MFTEMNGLPLLYYQYNQCKYLPSKRYLHKYQYQYQYQYQN